MPFQIIFMVLFSERAPLEMTYISMSPKVICEGAKRPSGGRVWEGFSSCQGRENFAFGARKTVFDAYFGQSLDLDLNLGASDLGSSRSTLYVIYHTKKLFKSFTNRKSM